MSHAIVNSLGRGTARDRAERVIGQRKLRALDKAGLAVFWADAQDLECMECGHYLDDHLPESPWFCIGSYGHCQCDRFVSLSERPPEPEEEEP